MQAWSTPPLLEAFEACLCALLGVVEHHRSVVEAHFSLVT